MFKVIISTDSDKTIFTTLFRMNMQEEKVINNLILEAILGSDKLKTIAYNIKKIRKTTRRADSMIVERDFERSYTNSIISELELENLNRSKNKQKKFDKKDDNNDKPKEDNRPWYQKHFWIVAIAGLIVYNIATFDSTKLKEAMNNANEQATQATNTQPAPR